MAVGGGGVDGGGGPGLVRATQPIRADLSSIVQRAREEFQNAYERNDLIAARELLQ
jgi:hypothetical protein